MDFLRNNRFPWEHIDFNADTCFPLGMHVFSQELTILNPKVQASNNPNNKRSKYVLMCFWASGSPPKSHSKGLDLGMFGSLVWGGWGLWDLWTWGNSAITCCKRESPKKQRPKPPKIQQSTNQTSKIQHPNIQQQNKCQTFNRPQMQDPQWHTFNMSKNTKCQTSNTHNSQI